MCVRLTSSGHSAKIKHVLRIQCARIYCIDCLPLSANARMRMCYSQGVHVNHMRCYSPRNSATCGRIRAYCTCFAEHTNTHTHRRHAGKQHQLIFMDPEYLQHERAHADARMGRTTHQCSLAQSRCRGDIITITYKYKRA